jgi:hypothetical protein
MAAKSRGDETNVWWSGWMTWKCYLQEKTDKRSLWLRDWKSHETTVAGERTNMYMLNEGCWENEKLLIQTSKSSCAFEVIRKPSNSKFLFDESEGTRIEETRSEKRKRSAVVTLNFASTSRTRRMNCSRARERLLLLCSVRPLPKEGNWLLKLLWEKVPSEKKKSQKRFDVGKKNV